MTIVRYRAPGIYSLRVGGFFFSVKDSRIARLWFSERQRVGGLYLRVGPYLFKFAMVTQL